ncbi:unnamed protein product [Ectocarpus sp. CCAP 1310/34]|nr:unnamed protein product [Ectocarpus sp. CCAP 1310/34]
MAGGPAVAAGAAASKAAPTATAATSGGSVPPAAAAGGMAGGPAVAAGAAASAAAPAATAATSGGSVPPAAAAGGMAGVPAAAGGAVVSAETPASTEQRQHEHMTEPESMVESGAARSAVLAELARMAGGPSRVSTSAAPVATPAPAHSAAMASDGLWTEMVHEGGGRLQEQREFVATPAVTRSRAKRDGPGPGIFALLATEDEIKRSIAELPAPGVAEPALPTGLVCDLETPETYGEAHAGPHHHIWTNAERKEFFGLNAVGTFEEVGAE